MSDDKKMLLEWIQADRDKLIGFFSGFVAAKSPNPPSACPSYKSHPAQKRWRCAESG